MALSQLSWLFGKWKGEGCGTYPNVEPFHYLEEIEFRDNGFPFITFTGNSWTMQHDKPMHWESGFLRYNQDTNTVALLLAENFGLTEILEGKLSENKEFEVTANKDTITRMSFSRSPAATQSKRVYKSLGPDQIEMKLYMATDEQPLQLHLSITYNRVDSTKS